VKEITVNDLMTTAVVTTAPDQDLVAVLQAMIAHRYSCMVVVTDNQPVGIITERDIVRLMAEYLNRSPMAPYRVVDVMTTPLVTVGEGPSLFEAMVISTSQKIRHLPVIDSRGALKGLVTQTDLAQAHFHMFEVQREIIEAQVTKRTRELTAANEQLKALTMVDALTGIGNRRAMEVDLEHTHAQALRYKRPYSVALLDVDFFKRYNDTYGHQSGDSALRQIAGHLQASVRASDRVYRYGGEEILLVLPETALHGALILATRIVESFADLHMRHEASPLGIVTLSCGVAAQSEEGMGGASWTDLVALADQGLYRSKSSGRNGVSVVDYPSHKTEPCIQ